MILGGLLVVAALSAEVVAVVPHHQVLKVDLRCPSGDTQKCSVVDQQHRLDGLLLPSVLDACLAVAKIPVSEEELNRYIATRIPSPASINIAAASLKRIALAVISSMNGGSDAEAIAELQRHDISAEQFVSAKRTWSRQQAEQVVDGAPEILRERFREQAVQEFKLRAVRKYVAEDAAARGRTKREAAAELIVGAARETGIRILDRQFTFKNIEGVLADEP